MTRRFGSRGRGDQDKFDREAYDDLIRGGGRGTVPCLRIERDTGDVEWLYESVDIVEYLNGQRRQPIL